MPKSSSGTGPSGSTRRATAIAVRRSCGGGERSASAVDRAVLIDEGAAALATRGHRVARRTPDTLFAVGVDQGFPYWRGQGLIDRAGSRSLSEISMTELL